MEAVVKINTTFGKHMLVEDQERRTVKYRPWGRCNQPKIKMEMKKRVALMKIRRTRKEAIESDTSSDSGSLVPREKVLGIHPRSSLIPIIPIPVKKKE